MKLLGNEAAGTTRLSAPVYPKEAHDGSWHLLEEGTDYPADWTVSSARRRYTKEANDLGFTATTQEVSPASFKARTFGTKVTSP